MLLAGRLLAVISIHPPRAGWDGRRSRPSSEPTIFQSTHPVRGGTISLFRCENGIRFQSTHPVRGGTPVDELGRVVVPISIHPPRAGWDLPDGSSYCNICDFNPPTPCGVGRAPFDRGSLGEADFNPPTPCGVGRWAKSPVSRCFGFQSTHPVRGGTPLEMLALVEATISIHPPRAGWDARHLLRRIGFQIFQSTHPVRGGTLRH